jgi:hypothetical protein
MDAVVRLVEMTGRLDAHRIREIAAAYRLHGLPHKQFALAAAKLAQRETEAYRAARDVSTGVHLMGMVNEHDPLDTRLAAQAGSNAGFAVATEDLIGTAGYSYREYAALVDPWFAGFTDQPLHREEEG